MARPKAGDVIEIKTADGSCLRANRSCEGERHVPH